MAYVVALTVVAAPVEVFAKAKDKPNSGFCKNGKHAAEVKGCKENREKKMK